MDKQKQIEEMHQILLSAGYDWWKTCPNGKTKSEYEAECFYNAGYRKIPEGSVVLTREEYEKITYENEVYLMEGRKVCQMEVETRHELEKLKRDFDYNLVQERKQIRKETAEKFAERLQEEYWWAVDDDTVLLGELIKRVCEICKEITEGE